MVWTEPAFSKSAVDKAGATFISAESSSEERELALLAINNWRSSHGFPLNTFQVTLRDYAARADKQGPLVAQRLKRLPSIRAKLQRFGGMKLSRMQDIGGCRAVVSGIAQVFKMDDLYDSSRMKHVLVSEKDYIAEPKDSGYRSLHRAYRYRSDKSETYNGLLIEVQIRSRLQHAWATAVETVGTFTRQALKSSEGEEPWLRFFALMSSELAIREGTPLVPSTPDDPAALRKEIRDLATGLDVVGRLEAFGQALRFLEEDATRANDRYWLLELFVESSTLVVRGYRDVVQATEEYRAIEQAIQDDANRDAVLVSVQSLAALRRAYPNYFLDTSAFLDVVRETVG